MIQKITLFSTSIASRIIAVILRLFCCRTCVGEVQSLVAVLVLTPVPVMLIAYINIFSQLTLLWACIVSLIAVKPQVKISNLVCPLFSFISWPKLIDILLQLLWWNLDTWAQIFLLMARRMEPCMFALFPTLLQQSIYWKGIQKMSQVSLGGIVCKVVGKNFIILGDIRLHRYAGFGTNFLLFGYCSFWHIQ